MGDGGSRGWQVAAQVGSAPKRLGSGWDRMVEPGIADRRHTARDREEQSEGGAASGFPPRISQSSLKSTSPEAFPDRSPLVGTPGTLPCFTFPCSLIPVLYKDLFICPC